MMKRQEFVLAVIVALAVPVIFGGVYFQEMCEKKGSNEIISNLDDTEVYFLGDKNIDGGQLVELLNEDYKSAPYIDFSIKYAKGRLPFFNYTIAMDEISTSRFEELKDIKWVLAQYAEENKKYLAIREGTLKDISERKTLLFNNTSVTLGELQQYRLYYYYDGKISSDLKRVLYGRIVLE